MDEPGIEDVMRKVMKDIEAKGSSVTEAQVREKIKEFDAIAIQQVKAEG